MEKMSGEAALCTCLIRLGAGGLGFGMTVGVWKRNPGIGNMDQSENSVMDLGCGLGSVQVVRKLSGGCNWLQGSKCGGSRGHSPDWMGGMVASLVAWAVAS